MRLTPFILKLEKHTIFTNKIALVRTIFAIGALFILTNNNLSEMTNFSLIKQNDFFVQRILFMNNYSIFNLFGTLWGKLMAILILLFSISGYFPKFSCFLQAWVHLSICNSFVVVEGGDQIASNLSILLIPLCLFDNRINQWDTVKKDDSRKAVNVFFNIYYFLIILQVAVLYLDVAIGKLFSEEWRNGTGLYLLVYSQRFWSTYLVTKDIQFDNIK